MNPIIGRALLICRRSVLNQADCSEVPFERELEYSRAVQRVDDLQRLETWFGNEIASLVWALSVSASVARRQVLDCIDAVAVLHIIVRMIKQVEGLHLQGNPLAFRQRNLSCESQVDLLCPRSIKRIQSHDRARACPVDSQRRVCRALVDSAVVQTAVGSRAVGWSAPR